MQALFKRSGRRPFSKQGLQHQLRSLLGTSFRDWDKSSGFEVSDQDWAGLCCVEGFLFKVSAVVYGLGHRVQAFLQPWLADQDRSAKVPAVLSKAVLLTVRDKGQPGLLLGVLI